MTERLTSLLREEALDLAVPPAPATAILAAGRSQRRRRAAASAVAGLAAVAVVAVVGGIALLGDGPRPYDGPDRALDPAAPVLQGWAVGQGSSVLLGTGEEVDVDGTVKSVYYTSAGVLVRTGQDASTDAPDSAYSLVTLDGEVTDFALDLGDRVPGTDPTLPYLAYADEADGGWVVVLRDVRDGEVVTQIPVEGDFTWGGWRAPPVALSGDHVYVGMDDATLDVAWRTGEVTESDALPASTMPGVRGGHETVGGYDEAKQVVDAQTGDVLLRTRPSEMFLVLSPDGRYAAERSFAMCTEDNVCTLEKLSVDVYDLATGTRVTIPVRGAGLGWTPTGDLLRVDDDSVDVCSPTTGECDETPVQVDGADLRLGGSVYEA